MNETSETPQPPQEATENQTSTPVESPQPSRLDRIKSILHIQSAHSRDIKVKPISVKLNRESIKNDPQLESTKP